MAHRQSLGATSTLSTFRGLPPYTSRAPSVAGSHAPSSLPPQFSDSVSVAPSYNTNASAIVNIWDLQPLESNPDIYEFSVGSGAELDDQPWLKWLVFARSSDRQLVKPSYPRYVGSDDVACTIALNLPEPKHISSVSVVLRGKYITSSMRNVEGEYTFLKATHTVDISGVRQSNETLPAGNYDYNIRFLFPTEVNLSDSFPPRSAKGKSQTLRESSGVVFPSPQTTRDAQVNIEYDLTLIVEHGKLFKRSAKLRTGVMFVPSIIPDPPSILRQIAYRDCVWAPGPVRDPAGWTSIPPLVLRGVFEGKDEAVEYTVSLANPLSYTRGSFVPVHLNIACENLRLLEAIYKKECHDIHIACRTTALMRPEREISNYLKAVAIPIHWKEDSQSNSCDSTFSHERISIDVKIVSDICFADDAPIYRHLAKSWPSVALRGEIHLSRGLLPSSDFLPFLVQYEVRVNAPTVPGRRFITPSMFGASAPITVATQFALDVERPVAMLCRHTSPRRRANKGLGDRGLDSDVALAGTYQRTGHSFASVSTYN